MACKGDIQKGISVIKLSKSLNVKKKQKQKPKSFPLTKRMAPGDVRFLERSQLLSIIVMYKRNNVSFSSVSSEVHSAENYLYVIFKRTVESQCCRKNFC